eukprot:gnl/MRDRNA2_/MRDRNA2_275140_c0_seq1.p1 gnl/MRDRNA2_/MRDRNA2_275140_c0~~gnl/MRDRNA2_/MRDRNA2_275140_c0_seq1.p1  ORF type:complete len:110 (+),score=12.29 gnl/MRDRNA2_/MRDRNA2_275140_c0_seq1:40-330(+)
MAAGAEQEALDICTPFLPLVVGRRLQQKLPLLVLGASMMHQHCQEKTPSLFYDASDLMTPATLFSSELALVSFAWNHNMPMTNQICTQQLLEAMMA